VTTIDIDALLDDPESRVIVCCGSGGVGKTTTAAARALRAAERGRQTVVLTIDPARRLAQALGLRELGNHRKQVQVEGFEPKGELWAMMLDMRRTFDDMVRVHAGPERAEQLDAIDVPRLELPALADGVDLGSLYELAEALEQQGVR